MTVFLVHFLVSEPVVQWGQPALTIYYSLHSYYTITSPVFEKVIIQLTNSKEFTVIARRASKTKKYIQRAFINGKEIFSPFITHEQIMAGATLELPFGELPDKEWGKEVQLPEF